MCICRICGFLGHLGLRLWCELYSFPRLEVTRPPPALISTTTQPRACQLCDMGAVTLTDARLALETLSGVLSAVPIPDPLKSAVTAIPTAALQIVAIAEVGWTIDSEDVINIDLRIQGVKKNKEDARALALYITNLTEATLKPFENIKGDPFDSSLTQGITQFHE